MATDSFTSSAAGVAAPSATLSGTPGFAKFSLIGGWEVVINKNGVYISQAPSFGGLQAAPVFPCTREVARQLALTILDVVT